MIFPVPFPDEYQINSLEDLRKSGGLHNICRHSGAAACTHKNYSALALDTLVLQMYNFERSYQLVT